MCAVLRNTASGQILPLGFVCHQLVTTAVSASAKYGHWKSLPDSKSSYLAAKPMPSKHKTWCCKANPSKAASRSSGAAKDATEPRTAAVDKDADHSHAGQGGPQFASGVRNTGVPKRAAAQKVKTLAEVDDSSAEYLEEYEGEEGGTLGPPPASPAKDKAPSKRKAAPEADAGEVKKPPRKKPARKPAKKAAHKDSDTGNEVLGEADKNAAITAEKKVI